MSEVVFVGTSDAFGAAGRRQAAILLRGPTGSVLLDCGATTNSGLSALGIAREELDAVVVSHFHADHFGGLPLLLLACLYEDGRRRPLRIVGPPGIEARVRAAALVLGHGLEERRWTFPLLFQELRAGAPANVGPMQVLPFETRHQPDSAPHGFRVQTGGSDVVYSGDTGWFEELPARVAGAELFICECTFVRSSLDFHLSYEVLAPRRASFDCGRMVLTHLGAEMAARRGGLALETADDGLALKL
jgi:ribonuclease BN (tRNA processing enzyme)